jgi:GTP-binding protein
VKDGRKRGRAGQHENTRAETTRKSPLQTPEPASPKSAAPAPSSHPTEHQSPLRHLPIEFAGSFPDPAQPLEPALPEIAFLGRSNVGKSSLLNALMGRRQGLARVSATPGKTTLLNVFRLPTFYLIDLPGYGFALASKGARAGYQALIHGYLERRPRVAGIVWLLDIRHPPSAEDRDVHEILVRRGLPVLAVLTKADKLGREAQRKHQRTIAAALGFEDDQMQPTSATTGMGIGELGASILAAVRGAEKA